MKPKIRLLTRITAFFLILFILGGYFSMVNRFVGEKPGWVTETLFIVGVLGSFLSGLSLCLSFLFFPKNVIKKDT